VQPSNNGGCSEALNRDGHMIDIDVVRYFEDPEGAVLP
jgi:hypothetical protein